jgi:hypothetical protein
MRSQTHERSGAEVDGCGFNDVMHPRLPRRPAFIALVALAVTGWIAAGVLYLTHQPDYGMLVLVGSLLPLWIFMRRAGESWIRSVGEVLEMTKPDGVVAVAVRNVEAELAEIHSRVEAEIATLSAKVELRVRVADAIKDETEQYRQILALTKEQAQTIGRYMAEFQEKRSRRQLWLGVMLGALISIPIGIGINLVT